jgi:FtsH-binding integral membrane protein
MVKAEINQELLYIFSFIFVIITLFFILSKTAYGQNGKLTCNNYVVNTYLYIIQGLVIMSLYIILLERSGLGFTAMSFMATNLISFFILAGIIFGLIYLIKTIDPEKKALKHFIWLTFLFCFSLAVFMFYIIAKYTGVLFSSIITLIIIVSGLTAVAFYNPDLISLSWKSGLISALLVGIVLQIILMFMMYKTGKAYNNFHIALSYGFICIFMGLILWKTKKIQENAKTCTVPDYINESTSVIISIVNLFTDIVNIKSRGKIGK